MFCTDILNTISSFSSNRDICRYLSTCKELRKKVDEVTFFERVYPLEKLPKNILKMEIRYADEISKIPPSVRFLEIGWLSSPIKSLPEHITHLRFTENFRFETKGIIPKSVTHLTLEFDTPFEICIPDTVTHLEIGKLFNRPLKGLIPNSVISLKFGGYVRQNIKGCIPNSVKYLTLGENMTYPMKGCIPNSVTHLTFGRYFNGSIKDVIPDSVTHLVFGTFFNQPIKEMSENYSLDKRNDPLDEPVKKYLPDSIKCLIFGDSFDKPIGKALPSSLEYLKFGVDFNHPLEHAIPPSLKYLKLGLCFEQEIPNLAFCERVKISGGLFPRISEYFSILFRKYIEKTPEGEHLAIFSKLEFGEKWDFRRSIEPNFLKPPNN